LLYGVCWQAAVFVVLGVAWGLVSDLSGQLIRSIRRSRERRRGR
jgi:hypothetical protein